MSTITMPNGYKYRISSVRRYIVVCWEHERWHAVKRSDKLDTALATWRRSGRYTANVPAHVIDVRSDNGPAVIR